MYTIFDGLDESGKHVRKERWIADEDMEAIRKGIAKDEPKKPDNVFDFRPRVTGRGIGDLGGSVSNTRTATPVAGQTHAGIQSSGATVGNLALDLDSVAHSQPSPVTQLRAVPPPEPVKAVEELKLPYSDQFDNEVWKQSRQKPGLLIRRIAGYDINELEYGINYLKQLPKGKTSADGLKYPHAGFFTWRVLAECGRLVRERKS